MKSKLKIGLIGCGRIAEAVHLRLLTRLKSTELVAVADRDLSRLKRAKDFAPFATALTDYQELLAMPEVEAVVICLPNALHAEAATAAFRQGKHVYLEKPLATNLEEAEQLLTVWKQSGCIGMIGFNYRFNFLYQRLKQLIKSQKINPIVGVRTVFCTPERQLPAWKEKRETGGGVLFDLASHHVDLMRYLFETEISEVFTRLDSQKNEQDTAFLEMTLTSGVRSQSFFSLCSAQEDSVEIYGKNGMLKVNRFLSWDVETRQFESSFTRFNRFFQSAKSLMRHPYGFKKLRAPWHEPSFQAALKHFVTAVRSPRSVSPDLWDGYQSLLVLIAAEQSAKIGRPVSIPSVANVSSLDLVSQAR